VSMRRIARRTGVSHAALAYKFGDKAGIFTAVATEGFRLAAEMIGATANGPNGLRARRPNLYRVRAYPPRLLRGDVSPQTSTAATT